MSTKSHLVKMAAATGVAFMLSGCQMLGIGGHSRAALSADTMPVADSFGADQLNQGRQALLHGRTADAIDAFIIARSYPEHAAAAYNGLAVAYSRIGRNDLTERYFQAAVALAPQEDKYRSNLALFYSRNVAPRAAAVAVAAEAVPVAQTAGTDALLAGATPMVVARSPNPVAARQLAGGITARTSPARLQRVSAKEVRVGAPAAATRVAHQPVIHVGRTAAPVYPVRITLSDVAVKPAKAN